MTDTSAYTLDLLAAEQIKFQAAAERVAELDPWLAQMFNARLYWIKGALRIKQMGAPLAQDDDLYHRAWDVLVQHAGAHDPHGHQRENFVRAACQREKMHRLTEYRFGGSLGFGGKFWRAGGKLYVSCYAEDRDIERNAVEKKVNAILAELQPACGVWGPP